MTRPRHLWSGDWRHESAAAAEELARRRAPTEEPSAAPPPRPPKPSQTAAARARALMRSLRHRGAVLAALIAAHTRGIRRRGTVLTAVAMLLTAGVAYAAVSSLRSGGTPPASGNTTAARSPSHAAAPAWLGIDTMSFPTANGVVVADVVPGSPAAAAGLQPGDVITQIGNRPVQTPTDIESALAGMHDGQQIEIQYDRGPSSYTTQATLAARPANGP